MPKASLPAVALVLAASVKAFALPAAGPSRGGPENLRSDHRRRTADRPGLAKRRRHRQVLGELSRRQRRAESADDRALTYDDRFFYIGLDCRDPASGENPRAVRRPGQRARHRRQRRGPPRHARRPPLRDRVSRQSARHPGRRELERRERQRGLLARLLLRHRGAKSRRPAGPRRCGSRSPLSATRRRTSSSGTSSSGETIRASTATPIYNTPVSRRPRTASPATAFR